jgi:predicted PurR-regulated permease PerM
MIQKESDRFADLLFYGVVLLVGYLAFVVVRPFLTPLVWAAIVAMALHPLHRQLEVRTGPTWAALLMTAATFLLIVLPVVTFVSALAGDLPQAVDFVQSLPQRATPENIRKVWDMLRERSPVPLPDDVTMVVADAAQRVVTFLAPRIGALVANFAAVVGSLIVMVFALFFMLRDSARFGNLLRRLLPFEEQERERMIAETRDLVIASVGAGLTVAATQGFIGGVAFWALGVEAAAAWGVVMAMSALIPVVGAALVWAPLAIWWLFTGEIVRGLVLVGIGAGIIGMADNILRPLLLSGRTSTNGLVIFLGLLGGVSAFGFVGLVLGPIILVTAGSLIETLTRRIHAKRIVSSE